jgi:hypothetical protein
MYNAAFSRPIPGRSEAENFSLHNHKPLQGLQGTACKFALFV